MPTIQVQLSEVKQERGSNNVLFTATDDNNRQIEREVNASLFATWSDFATWLIQQEVEFITMPDKEKTLSIVFHTETETDPETGEDVIIRVLDSVEIVT